MKTNFTKQDLKTGMVCEHRSGKLSIVAKDNFESEDNLIFSTNNRTDLKHCDNDTFQWFPDTITNRTESRSDFQKSVDIVAVYKPSLLCNGYEILAVNRDEINLSRWKLLWKEEQEVEMTIEEVCKALGKNIKIIK